MEFEYRSEKTQEKQKSIIDMDSILKRIPPIEGVFSPNEEVEKLWSVPKTERRKAVVLFRDKLFRQREAWALCRVNIEQQIESNPDLSREEMVKVISVFAPHYGFAENDIKVAESLIDDYMEMRKRVVEIRKKFPDDIALINRLTGLNFTEADAGDFEVSVGPMSIEILCSGLNAGRIHYKDEKSIREYKTGGFISKSENGGKPIYCLVVNKDYATTQPDYYAATILHEREHLKNRILASKLYSTSEMRADVREELSKDFPEIPEILRRWISKEVLGLESFLEDELYQRYESTENHKEKAFLLREYMRLRREDAFNSAKDEIIAIKKDGLFCSYDFFFKQDGDFYDYLADLRDWEKKRYDDLWRKTSQRVLVEEYRKIIENAICAFDKLRNNGYSTEEVIAMLSDKRLPEWPKTVKRLLVQKKKDKQGEV